MWACAWRVQAYAKTEYYLLSDGSVLLQQQSSVLLQQQGSILLQMKDSVLSQEQDSILSQERQNLPEKEDSALFYFPRESVELQHDKQQGCYPGDTIHFSLQVFNDSAGHCPTELSAIAYVELLTPDGTTICRRKLKLDAEAKAQHWVAIDSIFPSGFYELRAFTRYMTNWRDTRYYSSLIPVYHPVKKYGKVEKDGMRAIVRSSWRVNEMYSHMAYNSPNYEDVVYELTQPIEKQLMMYGHIVPKAQETGKEETQLEDHAFSIVIYQDDVVYSGEAVTDIRGRWGIQFPDLKGEWGARASRQKSHPADMQKHRVCVDELFSPRMRMYRNEDLEPEKFGMKMFKDVPESQLHDFKFYDCDYHAITAINKGMIAQNFYAWLGSTDRRFDNTHGWSSIPTILNVQRDTTFNKHLDLNLLTTGVVDSLTVCVDGVGFNNRPVVWIVNGGYRLVTNLSKRITDFKVLKASTLPVPHYLDEVKSVIVTNNPDAYKPYVRCSVLEKKKPITVFITKHDNYIWDDSRLLNTIFHGFDN